MAGYLIALPTPIEPVVSRPEMMPVTSYTSDQKWHVYISSSDTTADYAGSKLIGGWDEEGNAITAIDPDFAEYLQPAGLIDGEAPTTLAINNWLGAKPERAVQETPVEGTLPQFPVDAQPYQVTVTRTEILDDGFSHIPHGFRFRIEFAAPDTEPTARSFGVYADEACTQYLWTPGAFTLQGEGEEAQWVIDCPVGQRTAEQQEWHFAMLLGAAQVGRFTLPVGQQSTTRYFFEAAGPDLIEWAPGQTVVPGDLRSYEGVTYECIQGHTTLQGWEPPNVPALWQAI